MDFVLMFIMLVVYLALGAIMLTLSLSPKAKNKKEEPQIQGTSFIPSQMFMSTDGHGGIAVNEQNLKICLLHSPAVPPRLIHISSLVGSFLVKNGEVLNETLRTAPKSLISFQKLMQANAERLIKSWQTSSSQKDNQRIDLMVWIHDEDEPFHVVNFLNMETKEGGILFEKSLGTATHWHKVLDGLILQADQLACLQQDSDLDDTDQPTKNPALTSAAS
ncbi:hypothetical protein [Candidatus Nitrospira allomarina]|jgi:hypothetical protein|uniref:Uncharacterized protein n=1 Tax=Candidatus Nitrospira allomarina TaxID=3020900 RepID=A0AA96GDX1_9BACT|nr:hypothetical protein [Candidatus Nitrospira allomarina]WNM59841.1 hypothetical protein PP769_08820 [Candidatus Nitrospira allomarina]